MKMNTGIEEKNRKEIAHGLAKLLADGYALYLKTQNYHWNVKGVMFQSLHALFQLQYEELATAVDEIAERIRALGFAAPGSFSEFAKKTAIPEAKGETSSREMVGQLAKDNETVIQTARDLFAKVEDTHDQATLDLLTRRMQLHEKNAWMLRSHLEE